MFATIALMSALAAGVSAAPTASSAGKTNVFTPTSYSVVSGIFIQDSAAYNSLPSNYSMLTDSFGLIDKSTNAWQNLTSYINNLNAQADSQTAYKLMWMARHGEGWHNYAPTVLGDEAFSCYWGTVNGNGNLTWGPDAALTPNGTAEGLANNAAWKQQIQAGITLPQSFYSSPMQRSMQTLNYTWSDIVLNQNVKPMVKENLRETIGLYTYEQRFNQSTIAATFPWNFEPGFSQVDQLWNPFYSEAPSQQTLRTLGVLNQIFATDSSSIISITAHSGTIYAAYEVFGHQYVGIGYGGFIPILVKATSNPTATQSTFVGGPSGTLGACSSKAKGLPNPLPTPTPSGYVYCASTECVPMTTAGFT
ncbi:putative phosphoglycerate mutase pmu1 [Cystobasidiomycetes sp. EMM_F5]